jgi:hypothetical protein
MSRPGQHRAVQQPPHSERVSAEESKIERATEREGVCISACECGPECLYLYVPVYVHGCV